MLTSPSSCDNRQNRMKCWCLLLLISVKGSLGVVVLDACFLLVMQILDHLNQKLWGQKPLICVLMSLTWRFWCRGVFEKHCSRACIQDLLWEAEKHQHALSYFPSGWAGHTCKLVSGWYSPSLWVLGVNQLFSLPGFCSYAMSSHGFHVDLYDS